MAAAEYFNPGGQPVSGQQPSPYPPRPSSTYNNNNYLSANPPYPMSDAPPPYSAYADPRPHSQPPPQQRLPTNDQYWHPTAPPSTGPPPNTAQYAPEKIAHNGQRPIPQYRPSEFAGPSYFPPTNQQQPQYQQPQGYVPLAGTTAMQQVFSNGNGGVNGARPSTTPGYRPSQLPYRDDHGRERSKSRSRDGSRHRKHHHHDRPQPPHKKSSGVNTFLGAGGGAILGDAIFPGLGTLGGAILGGLGGHEYSKKKSKSYSNPPPRVRDRSYSNDEDYYYEDHRRGRKY